MYSVADIGLFAGDEILFLHTAIPSQTSFGGDLNVVKPTISYSSGIGVVASDMTNVIYNQIWIVPTKINAGLVTKTEYYDVYIWNAYIYQVKTIQEVVRVSLFDVYFSQNLSNRQLKTLELLQTSIVCEGSGVPFFDGYFKLKISGEYYYIYVLGQRILVLPVVHFLADSYRFIYQFEVAKAINNVMKEQRRLIHPSCIRSISGNVYIPELSKNFTVNIMDRLGGKVLGVSIPHEKMTPTANNIQGLTTVYVNETISNYTELSSSKFILAFREDNFAYECLVVSSIDLPNKKITLNSAVVGDFPKSVTVLFPLLVSKADSVSVEAKVGNYAIADISITEVFTG
ncbi:MAG: hypothetical protein N2712_07835 [Brevinematales bacterium]|nr:hypothetical protein [Brevinematales bacterium]